MKKIILCIIVALILLSSKTFVYAGNSYMYPVVANNTKSTIQGFYVHWWANSQGHAVGSGNELPPFGIATTGHFDGDSSQYVGGNVDEKTTAVRIDVLIGNKCYHRYIGDTSSSSGEALGLHSWPNDNSTGAFVFLEDINHYVSDHDFVMLIQVNGMSKDKNNYIGISESDGDCGDIPLPPSK